MPTNETSKPQAARVDDRDRHFRTDHLTENLGGHSARAGAVTLAAQVLKFAIATAGAIVLARLLTPQDYGLIGMVIIIVNFVGMFPFLGLSTATMRWSELNHQQVSTLFWINVGLSGAIALVTIATAPLLAWFYHEPRLIPITVGYSVSLLLMGFYIQHEAILSRQMRFGAIAAVEIVAHVAGFTSAIVAALYGARYWALVLNQMVMNTATIIGVWAVCKWRPGWPVRGSGVRAMLSFGGNLTGYNVMNYLARNIDNALIGKFWGGYQLGLYSRAYQMLLTPMIQINAPLVAVAVPALSRLADSPDRYRAAYLKVLEKIAMVTMPLVGFGIATSDWLVVFLLGEQWRESGRIFMWLGVAAIVQPVARSTLWLFTTQGRSREMFRWGVMGSVIAIVAIVAGLPWGAMGVAASYALTDVCITTPLLLWYAGRRGPVRAADVYRTIAPAAFASVVSLTAVVLARPWLARLDHLVLRLTIAFAVTAVLTLLVLMILPAGRAAIRNSKEMLLLMRKRESTV